MAQDERSYMMTREEVDVILCLLDNHLKANLDRASLLRKSVGELKQDEHNGYHPNIILAQAFVDQAHGLTVLAIKLRTQR